MTIYYVAISLLIQSDNMQATNEHVGVRQLAQGMLDAPHIRDRTHNPVPFGLEPNHYAVSSHYTILSLSVFHHNFQMLIFGNNDGVMVHGFGQVMSSQVKSI